MMLTINLDFEKHFTVYCPTSVTDYTTLQQKKFFILYNLYVEKYKESKKEVKIELFIRNRELVFSILFEDFLKKKTQWKIALKHYNLVYKEDLSSQSIY